MNSKIIPGQVSTGDHTIDLLEIFRPIILIKSI